MKTIATETITLTKAEYDAICMEDGQSYIDEYADADNRDDICHSDDLTPEQWSLEHAKAQLCELTETDYTFVRDSLAHWNIIDKLNNRRHSPPWNCTPAERRTINRLLDKLGFDEHAHTAYLREAQ